MKKLPVPKGQRLKDITAFCMLGATNKQIAEFLEVSTKTFERWLESEPKVRKAVMEGKDFADAKVSQALYERAIGAESWDEKPVSLGEGQYVVVKLKKKAPPDTLAATKWLFNRRPTQWRDRSESLNLNVEATLDLTDILGEYARRHGPEAAKAIAEHHGYAGVVIDGESVLVKPDES